LVPINYVEPISISSAQQLLHAQLHARISASKSETDLSSELPFEVMAKVDNLTPSNSTELAYVLADTLVVHQIDASGWWFGTNLRTSAVGWFAPEVVVRKQTHLHRRARSLAAPALQAMSSVETTTTSLPKAEEISASTPSVAPQSTAPSPVVVATATSNATPAAAVQPCWRCQHVPKPNAKFCSNCSSRLQRPDAATSAVSIASAVANVPVKAQTVPAAVPAAVLSSHAASSTVVCSAVGGCDCVGFSVHPFKPDLVLF
jgi:hypothetical protein